MKVFSRHLIDRTINNLSRRPIQGSHLQSLVIPHITLCPHQFRLIKGRAFSTEPEDVFIMELGMPALSPTMEKGSIVAWHKKVGDYVTTGEVLADIETDKATVAFESTEDGYLAGIMVEAGVPDVPVNKLVAVMVEEEEEIEMIQERIKTDLEEPKMGTETSEENIIEEPVVSEETTGEALSLSPAVNFLVHTHHICTSSIIPTGPGGRILKGDILKALANNTAKFIEPEVLDPTSKVTPTPVSPPPTVPAPDGQFEKRSVGRGLREFVDIPHTAIKKDIATQVSQSKFTIPHTYTHRKIKMNALFEFCETLKVGNQESPSVDDFIIKAAGLACRANPEINSTYDSATKTANLCDTVDIGVAVATEHGFITPVLEKVDTLRIGQISTKVKDLVTRVQDGKSQPNEFIGGKGSFTITNLGRFGVTNFTSVINPPETCNLAIGRSQSRVVVGSDDSDIQTGMIIEVQLACDERAVEQHTASKWLSCFTNYLEDPSSMLSG